MCGLQNPLDAMSKRCAVWRTAISGTHLTVLGQDTDIHVGGTARSWFGNVDPTSLGPPEFGFGCSEIYFLVLPDVKMQGLKISWAWVLLQHITGLRVTS